MPSRHLLCLYGGHGARPGCGVARPSRSGIGDPDGRLAAGLPPIEFREPGSQEVSGASADLLREIAKRLKLELTFVQAEYAALIPGIEAKRFLDMASGGISDTGREQKLDFVNYMQSGGSMMVRAEDDANATRPSPTSAVSQSPRFSATA